MNTETMDAVFHALSSVHRRRIIELIKSMPGCSVKDVCKPFEISRIAVMKHLNVLQEAGLVISQKPGRSRELYFNVDHIQRIYDRWTTEYRDLWDSHSLDFKSEAGRRPSAGNE